MLQAVQRSLGLLNAKSGLSVSTAAGCFSGIFQCYYIDLCKKVPIVASGYNSVH